MTSLVTIKLLLFRVTGRETNSLFCKQFIVDKNPKKNQFNIFSRI